MKKEKKTTSRLLEVSSTETAGELHPEIHNAIADGFGEYRRQIADIRARHGRKSRRSLEVLN